MLLAKIKGNKVHFGNLVTFFGQARRFWGKNRNKNKQTKTKKNY